MNQNRNISHFSLKIGTAFSLIELSIVVLIIGILIAGVTQGSRLVKQSRLTTAKNLTATSSVASIPDIVTWFETTSDNSVTTSTNGQNPEDGDLVSSWNDINSQSNVKVTVTSSGGLMPTYSTNGINNLPSISFNGNQYLNSAIASGGNTPLAAGATSFTFVEVWKKSNTTTTSSILDESATTNIASTRAGIVAVNGTYGFVGDNNDFWNTATYSTRTMATIITVSNTGVVKIYDNNSTYTGSITPTTQLSNSVFRIGARATDAQEKYSGLISEIIIFSRTLKASEVADIKSYLSKKYAITIL